MDSWHTYLQGFRQKRQGIRFDPETPSLVCKVCHEIGKGELWLGPLPVAGRMQGISSLGVSLQISCFQKHPTRVALDDKDPSTKGMCIPGSMQMTVEMSNDSRRVHDIRRVRQLLVSSLRQGDNAYVHCMTGLCRAPLAAAILGGILTGTDPAIYFSRIAEIRNVQMHKALDRMGGKWMESVAAEPFQVWQKPDAFLWVTQKNAVVHAATRQDDTFNAMCKEKYGKELKGSVCIAETIEQAPDLPGGFCHACAKMLSASNRLAAHRRFNCSTWLLEYP